jgi:hypothetical protein
LQHRAVTSALFRHIDDAMGHRVAGAANADLAIFKRHTATGWLGDAEQRLCKLRAPGADKAVNAEDFALAQLKGNVAKLGRVRIVFNLQHRLADGDILLGESLIDRPPDHHPHDIVLPRIGKRTVADGVPVAENRIIIGDFVNLIEFVADEQDGFALRFQPRHDAEQVVHFLARQGCSRLVHDDDARIHRQRAGNGDQMALRDRQFLQLDAGVDRRFQRG